MTGKNTELRIQEVIEAREFVRETTRNAWVPEDMKRCLERCIAKLCNVIEVKDRSLLDLASENFKLRVERQDQRKIIESVLNLKLDFERINPTSSMSKLTKQCIDAYNTCVGIKEDAMKRIQDKARKDAEKAFPRAVLD